MIEVFPNLFIGDQNDEMALTSRDSWFVIHACKEPYHRQALGYSGRAASKDHPEYLMAKRDGCLILNLVDVPDPKYISLEIMAEAVATIHEQIGSKRVLVHCNQGMSRSPSIAFLYLVKHTDIFSGKSLDEALSAFQAMYSLYSPAAGVASFIRQHWHVFSS
ncbi:protein-tyrosine phosphatase family protein [Kordiimonas marina]|uniref:protein-tyrosine phosphatase family protein n=1 Tax=Kordiimonas marina TaxID=2872312 RepID=UPI001FF2D1BD|nr:dual specificity protein phosphatase [Kordiimonas marina]MCJ9429666.1 dual specificity protein phosphatase family protein [Kordiimonas marina]